MSVQGSMLTVSSGHVGYSCLIKTGSAIIKSVCAFRQFELGLSSVELRHVTSQSRSWRDVTLMYINVEGVPEGVLLDG